MLTKRESFMFINGGGICSLTGKLKLTRRGAGCSHTGKLVVYKRGSFMLTNGGVICSLTGELFAH